MTLLSFSLRRAPKSKMTLNYNSDTLPPFSVTKGALTVSTTLILWERKQLKNSQARSTVSRTFSPTSGGTKISPLKRVILYLLTSPFQTPDSNILDRSNYGAFDTTHEYQHPGLPAKNVQVPTRHNLGDFQPLYKAPPITDDSIQNRRSHRTTNKNGDPPHLMHYTRRPF